MANPSVAQGTPSQKPKSLRIWSTIFSSGLVHLFIFFNFTILVYFIFPLRGGGGGGGGRGKPLWRKVLPIKNQRVCGYGPLFFRRGPFALLFSLFLLSYFILFFRSGGRRLGPRAPPLDTSLGPYQACQETVPLGT